MVAVVGVSHRAAPLTRVRAVSSTNTTATPNLAPKRTSLFVPLAAPRSLLGRTIDSALGHDRSAVVSADVASEPSARASVRAPQHAGRRSRVRTRIVG
jgi:hypothetical protein